MRNEAGGWTVTREQAIPVADPKCPYCGGTFDPIPTRKKKCAACKNQVQVKYRPTNPQKRLVTAEQAEVIEAEWAAYHAENALRRGLSERGVAEGEGRGLQARLAKALGRPPTHAEMLDAAEREGLGRAIKIKDWHQVSMLRFLRALRLHQAGEPHWPDLVEASKASLLNYASQGVTKVEVLACGEDSCPACRKVEGKKFSVEKAAKAPPIPVQECETWKTAHGGWCRCTYVAADFG
jgi:hypothetical protein